MKRESTAIEKSKKPSDNIFTLMWHTRVKKLNGKLNGYKHKHYTNIPQ